MPRNPEFTSLLDKNSLKHSTSTDALIDTARQKLVFNPADYEAYLLAFGDVPGTYEEFRQIVGFVKEEQRQLRSLFEALQNLNKAGDTIFS